MKPRLGVPMIEGIKIRVSTDEKQALRAAASKRGLTLSDFVREAAAEAAQRVAA